MNGKESYPNKQEEIEVINVGDDVYVKDTPHEMFTSPLLKVSEIVLEDGRPKAISLVGPLWSIKRMFIEISDSDIYVSKSRKQWHVLKFKSIEESPDGLGILRAGE